MFRHKVVCDLRFVLSSGQQIVGIRLFPDGITKIVVANSDDTCEMLVFESEKMVERIVFESTLLALPFVKLPIPEKFFFTDEEAIRNLDKDTRPICSADRQIVAVCLDYSTLSLLYRNTTDGFGRMLIWSEDQLQRGKGIVRALGLSLLWGAAILIGPKSLLPRIFGFLRWKKILIVRRNDPKHPWEGFRPSREAFEGVELQFFYYDHCVAMVSRNGMVRIWIDGEMGPEFQFVMALENVNGLIHYCGFANQPPFAGGEVHIVRMVVRDSWDDAI